MFAKDKIWSIFGLVFIVFGVNPDLVQWQFGCKFSVQLNSVMCFRNINQFCFLKIGGPTYNFLQLKHRIFISVLAGGSRFIGRNLIKFKTSKYPNLNLDGYSYIEKIVVAI